MKTFLCLATLALSSLWCGCESRERTVSTPLAPGPTSQAAAVDRNPVVSGERWNLTTTLLSVEGSAPFWRASVGTSVDWLLAVQREGTHLSLLYDVNNWPTDHVLHIGNVSGDSFRAAADPYPGYQPGAEYVFAADVIGRFSPDRLSLSARERWIYKLTNGTDLIVTFEWKGARR